MINNIKNYNIKIIVIIKMEEDRIRIIKSIPLMEDDKVNYFAKLPKDIIIYIALLLEKPDIISYCKTSKKFDDTICQNKQFWVQKLERDFGVDYYKTKKLITSQIYYDIGILTNKLNLKETIEQIHQIKFHDLDAFFIYRL